MGGLRNQWKARQGWKDLVFNGASKGNGTRRDDMVSPRCSALVQVCEKSHLFPKKVGETSTEETSKRKRHAPASSLPATESSLPATESSLPAPASSLPALQPYFSEEKIQFKGKQVSHADFILLLDYDTPVQGGMGIAFRLTEDHINPNSFAKMNVSDSSFTLTYFQIFSHSIAKAFEFYRLKNSDRSEPFKQTETTQLMCQMLNDAFDVLNGRKYQDRITIYNWDKKLLLVLLHTINETKEHSFESKSNGRPFLSDASLMAMRITITSAIELIGFLLKTCEYTFVLSGKFYQDCLERFSGIVRSCGGGQDAPTASTSLRIYWMLSIYFPVKNALRIDGNIDEEERMHILTSNKDWLIFAKNREMEQKDGLDLVQSNATYYNCGYLIITRKEDINCENCLDSLTAKKSELPCEFYAVHITKLKAKDFYASLYRFLLHQRAKVERILQKHLQSHQPFIRDSFQLVIRKVVGDGLSLPPIWCEAHRHEQLSYLIYEYVDKKTIASYNKVLKGPAWDEKSKFKHATVIFFNPLDEKCVIKTTLVQYYQRKPCDLRRPQTTIPQNEGATSEKLELLHDGGSIIHVDTNDEGEVNLIYIQLQEQLEPFAKYPEAIQLDDTHRTNRLRMPLYTIMIKDNFELG
ncbi:Cell division ftsj-like protein [Daphnia magna]|uniref:Cell division ftsj-like protein n=1 Tax=Daphnia magna TaxID=35525 RepID=A0A164SMH5_9CRUS|nr:Cell division ftsj-like protein [Daphnia magna]